MKRAVTTNVRLAAERQIHAAIAHFRGGDFECAITLCSAAEGRIPSPSDPGWLREVVIAHAAPDDDFNFAANWLKHDVNPDDLETEQAEVLFWLNRAISKYRARYGDGTVEMAALFPWAIKSVAGQSA